MLAEGARWFDRYVRGQGTVSVGKGIAVSPDPWRGRPTRFASVPKTVDMECGPNPELRPCLGSSSLLLRRPTVIKQAGRVRYSLRALGRSIEVFGSPTVEVTAAATNGWSRIVTVLSARTPSGTEIVVGGGGVPTKAGKRTYRIALSNQATFIPKGSRLTVTVGSSSLAQSPGNLLYLDLPFAAGASLAVSSITLRTPILAKTVSQ